MTRSANDFIPEYLRHAVTELSSTRLKQCIRDCTRDACGIDNRITRMMAQGVGPDAPAIRLQYAVQEHSWQIVAACYNELHKRGVVYDELLLEWR